MHSAPRPSFPLFPFFPGVHLFPSALPCSPGRVVAPGLGQGSCCTFPSPPSSPFLLSLPFLCFAGPYLGSSSAPSPRCHPICSCTFLPHSLFSYSRALLPIYLQLRRSPFPCSGSLYTTIPVLSPAYLPSPSPPSCFAGSYRPRRPSFRFHLLYCAWPAHIGPGPLPLSVPRLSPPRCE